MQTILATDIGAHLPGQARHRAQRREARKLAVRLVIEPEDDRFWPFEYVQTW